MLDIVRLDVAIGSVEILRGVSLQLAAGEMCGLVGRNGAGKTTLMKSIIGLLRPRAGTIAFNGQSLAHVAAHHRSRAGIGYMPEDRRLVPDLTVEENLYVPAWASKTSNPRVHLERVYALIPELRELAPRRGLALSGGQQKLAALGRALMCGTRLLLLDEPFEGVAPALAQRLAEVIANLRREGMTVMLSASDLQHSVAIVDRVLVIDRGTVRPRSA